MDSKPSPSLFTASIVPSTAINPLLSLSSSLPIRAPPSSDIEEDKASSISETSSDSDSFQSDGDEDDFENASERAFVADPDEKTLEIPAVVVESEAGVFLPPNRRMPIAHVSSEDDDEGLVDDVDGDGFSGVVRVSPLRLCGLELDEKAEIGVFGGGGKGDELEGSSSVAASETVENRVFVEDRVLGRVEGNSLEESVENGSEVSKKEILDDNSVVIDENVSSVIEDVCDVGMRELQLMESKEDNVEEEKIGVDWNSAMGGDLSAGIASEISDVGVVAENGASEMQAADSVVEKTAVLGSGYYELNPVIENAQAESFQNPGFEESEPSSTDLKVGLNGLVDLKQNEDSEMQVAESGVENIADSGSGSDQASPVIEEASDLEFVGAVTSVEEKNGFVSSEENPILVTTAITKVPEHDSNEKPEFVGGNLVSDNCQTFPAGDVESGRYESQTVSSIDESVKYNLNKVAESQHIVVEDSKHVELDREGMESSCSTLDGVLSNSCISKPEVSIESLYPDSISNQDLNRAHEPDDEDDEGLASEGHAQGPILGASKTAEEIIREMEHGSSSSQLGFESSWGYSQKLDGQILIDSDEEVDIVEEGDGKELFDSAALAALLKAASNMGPDGSITINAPDEARFFSTEGPAGLGPTVASLKPAPPRHNRPKIFSPSELAVVGESNDNVDEEEKKLQEKIQGIRVKFLRLVQRLGHSPEDTVAAQVLYRLGLAEGIRRGRQTNRAFSLESARKTAMELETAGTADLDFSCNILILGKTGVGKSATINSIFGEEKTPISAFEPSTTAVKEIVGTLDGVKIRVIDTPGLRSSVMDQSWNRKILLSIKKFTKKCPPDIVLYIDRLDTQTRDFNDLPLLRSISTTLGSSIWLNAIVALTHASSAPPDGPNGSPLSYEVFIAQRSHIVQHSIRQAAGDMRLMNPVALVENHRSCRRNREGHSVLPNGQNWRPQLLLLCYSSNILSEANSLLKLKEPSAGKLFGFRVRSPPLPYLLSSLLQSRAHPKLSPDMGGDNVDSDIDLDDLSDSDHEEEDEYDQLPPFKPLKKSQIAKLSKEQWKAYFDEYDYRVKLLQKKQWREELRRLRESKKRGKEGQDDFGYGDMGVDDFDHENGSPATVPVPLPDMVLPPSFDGDNPAYRYRFLEPTSQLLARPVLDTHGWDHDCGYDGVSLDESVAIAKQFPAAVSVQITKDKKEFNIHLDSSISTKHGENGSSLAGFDIQSVGKQLAYILRGETKFQNFKKNKTAAGVSVTFLGENVVPGLKVEDQISIGKQVSLVASTGAVRSQGDVAYGANLEVRLREKEYPIGQDLSTLGLSLMRWRGDLALGANLQSQLSVGRNSKMAVRVGLNNKLSGQITVRTSSSEQLQLALVGIVPVAIAIFRTIWPGESYLTH